MCTVHYTNTWSFLLFNSTIHVIFMATWYFGAEKDLNCNLAHIIYKLL